jgi:hypothetical protein
MSPEIIPNNQEASPMPYERKADDRKIIEFNNIGLSLSGIAERLGVHPTTVTHRLKALGVSPIDTRRAFMEDIYEALPPAQQEWLMDQLGPGFSAKDFIRSLLIKAYVSRAKPATPS